MLNFDRVVCFVLIRYVGNGGYVSFWQTWQKLCIIYDEISATAAGERYSPRWCGIMRSW